jgi:hypothetical protein
MKADDADPETFDAQGADKGHPWPACAIDRRGRLDGLEILGLEGTTRPSAYDGTIIQLGLCLQ